jgi:hypothetical protein
MLNLRALKASDFVILHGRGIFTSLLHESNHCLIALWIEFVIISRLNLTEGGKSRFECLFNWVSWDLWLQIVSEVSNESKSIFELNIESLIIDGSPLSFNCCLSTFWFTSAEYSLSLVVLSEVDVVEVSRLEVEMMVVSHQLHFVWHGVCAQLLLVEQVHLLGLSTHVESPHTEQLLSEAMHWLISLNDWWISEWIHVINQTSNS